MFYKRSEKGLLSLGQASVTSLLASWTSWDDKLRQKHRVRAVLQAMVTAPQMWHIRGKHTGRKNGLAQIFSLQIIMSQIYKY